MEGRNLFTGMTPEELEEVQRVHDVMLKAMDQEIWRMAEFMVTRQDDQLFGKTEFTMREKALRMGAQALEATVNDYFEAARQRWTDEACHQLKHEGGPAVRARLEALDVSAASAEARETHRCTVRYFRNHEHRMDYPRYVRNGWQIGSGPVESACKTVVGNRLKGGGMRWGEEGADAVCHLRALYGLVQKGGQAPRPGRVLSGICGRLARSQSPFLNHAPFISASRPVGTPSGIRLPTDATYKLDARTPPYGHRLRRSPRGFGAVSPGDLAA